MPIVDTWGSGPLATVLADLTGQIQGIERYNGSSWQTMEPTVNVGTTIGLRCEGLNTSTVNVQASLVIAFHDPMGSVVGQATTKSASLSPGAKFSHERKITASISGQYTAYISLVFT